MATKRAGEAAEGQPPAKKPVGARGAASGAPPLAQAPVAAAPGAPPLAQAPVAAAPGAPPLAQAPVPPLCTTQLLETESASLQKDQLAEWVRAVKTYVDHALHSFLQERMSFTLPPKCSTIPPLAVNQAASGANLSAFREGKHCDNMMASFNRTTKQYEAAGARGCSSDLLDIDDVTSLTSLRLWRRGCRCLWRGGVHGIAADEARRDWLDCIVDRCVMYKAAGHKAGYAQQLGGGEEFVEKASKYFGGTMMEARRLLMSAGGDDDDEGDDEDEDDEDEVP